MPTVEERLAFRLREKEKARLPIDVDRIAAARADVSSRAFPIDIDGLTIGLKVTGIRPQIWLNRNLQHHRRRFTLAHEIGHLIIPWHVGTIADELDADRDGASQYRELEGEANRFAAELLMPRDWVVEVCLRADHLSGAMQNVAQVADVSQSAAALRVIQFGPPNYLVAAEQDGVIFWSARTQRTRAKPPHVGERIEAINMPAFEPPQIVRLGRTGYFWWRERPAVGAPPRPEQPWRAILVEILRDVEPGKRQKVQQRLNAIIGLAFNKYPVGTNVDVLFRNCLAALQNRNDSDPDMQATLLHPDIQIYALARCYDRAENA